ncbi:MAG: ABC transporter ATP-binding protein [Chloroflexi bacterium]|nr:ABC transporter ATP-binding protein [Chloroflexota bacterium]
MATVIRATHLRKTYGSTVAVDDLSLEVNEGEIFGMVGPNGAGKTTTIECLEGLRRPDHGEMRVLELDPVRQERSLRLVIGTQLQKAQLPDRLKVGEALDLFASFYPHPTPWPALLERLGLAEKKGAYISQLSGGQQQRLFIALALINKPRLVFFDELTTGLDPQARHTIWDLVREIRGEGRTVFLTTHLMEEAEKLCDRVAIVDHGRVVANDTPAALVRNLGAEGRVLFNMEKSNDLQALKSIGSVTRVEQDGPRVIVYGRSTPSGQPPLITEVVNALYAQGVAFSDIRMEQSSLEDVFLQLTGRALRD